MFELDYLLAQSIVSVSLKSSHQVYGIMGVSLVRKPVRKNGRLGSKPKGLETVGIKFNDLLLPILTKSHLSPLLFTHSGTTKNKAYLILFN